MIKKILLSFIAILQLLVELSFSTGVMFNITQIKSTFSFIFIIASNHYIGDLITLVNL
ncbi:hypothetical protein BANRA_01063 [Acinetobacter baumannii]|nr:hypothetical protein BANRA_01063 [Acinetobacter baumannii]